MLVASCCPEVTSTSPRPFSPRKACLFSVQDAVQCAERIGYPVMLKASEGRGREKMVDGQGGGSRGVPQLSNGIKLS